MMNFHGYRYRSSALLEFYMLQTNKDEMKALRDALGFASIETNAGNIKNHAKEVIEAIEIAGGNSISNAIRGCGVPYLEMLNDTAKELGIANTLSYSTILDIEIPRGRAIKDDDATAMALSHTENFENRIVEEFLKRAYDGMTPQQRKDFDDAIARTLESRGGSAGRKLAGIAGIMAVANMGGFATYTLVSSVLSAASFGALPFGAFTFASSLLHVLIGPVGWIALASYAVGWLGKPDQKKRLSVIVLIAMLRQRIGRKPNTAR